MPDIVTGKTFVDGERGITAAKMNQIISQAVIQPSFVTSKPSSSTLDPTDQMLEVKGAGTYATITGQQLIDSVSASVTQNITPTIWSVRLRSFQALSNNTFEVDQRTVGTGAPTAGGFALDRWFYTKNGTMTFSVLAQQDASASPILLPGTSFALSQNFLRFTLGTQQSTLGASDKVALYQYVEGPRLRELISDVHSLQLLARSSVSGLSFGVSLQDVAGTRTLVKLATIPSANTWTLIPLANLPVWPVGTTWSTKPGVQGYFLGICLAAGSTITAAANNTWQSANVVGALGQSNFAAQTVGSTFDLSYISHEPGAQASNPPIDCPFTQNYDECLRYFQKSYPYSQAIGTPSSNSFAIFQCPTAVASGPFTLYGGTRFSKPMAKTPTCTAYNNNSGTANGAFAWVAASGTIANTNGNISVTGVTANSSGISALNSTGSSTSPVTAIAEWTADTGW